MSHTSTFCVIIMNLLRRAHRTDTASDIKVRYVYAYQRIPSDQGLQLHRCGSSAGKRRIQPRQDGARHWTLSWACCPDSLITLIQSNNAGNYGAAHYAVFSSLPPLPPSHAHNSLRRSAPFSCTSIEYCFVSKQIKKFSFSSATCESHNGM
jgi:hypothetical protein